jgi:hypothetical protein
MKILVTIAVLGAVILTCIAPALARRGNPTQPVTVSTFKSQFYVIDSDDDNTDPRQPSYWFVDTLYDAAHWHRVTGFTNNDDGYAEVIATDSILYYHSNTSLRLPPRYMSTNGLLKLTRDTFYLHPVTSPANGTMPAGLANNFEAIVCPLWADMEFRTTGDSSKVFYRMTTDSCYVTYYNLFLKGTNGTVHATFQVAFSRTDSSITFNYKSFDGAFNGTPAAMVFQNEATIGVQNSQAIYGTMYLDRGTYYAKSYSSQLYAKPLHNSLAVKFIRVIPNWIHAKSIDFPPYDRYEMTNNSFIPKVTVDNFSDQDHYVTVNTKVFDITTGFTIYNRTDSILVPFDDYVQFTGALYQGIRCGSYHMVSTLTVPSLGPDGWIADNIITRDFTLLARDTGKFYDNFITLDPCYWHIDGATWAQDDSVMFDPPSPRSTGAVILNRRDINGNPYLIPTGSDTITTTSINLTNASNVWFSFSYQRGLSTDSMKAGIKSRVLIGPEPVDHDSLNQAVLQGDSLIIEALASSGSEWSPLDSNWKVIATLYGGLDYTTQKFRMQLDPKYVHNHTRLRIRLAAKDDHPKYGYPLEDDDNWVLDEIQISAPSNGQTDLEPTNFDLGSGNYTHIPRAVKLITPKVTIANNGLVTNSAVYVVHAVIKDVLGRSVYDKTQSFINPAAHSDVVVAMPVWDIGGAQGGSSPNQYFTVKVNIAQNFNEYYRLNDTNTFFRALSIDDRYALDDGIPDTVGTMLAADNNWFYYDFVPLASDSLRGFDIYNLGASGNTNWTFNIKDTSNAQLGTRAFSYNATAIGGGFIRGTFTPFYMTAGTTYRIQCIETQGYNVGGDASKGLMWETTHSFNNPAYAALYPSIVSSFRTSSNFDYVTAKRNAAAGGPILPMIRPVFQGSSTYLPVAVVNFTGSRTDLGSVNLDFRTAKEESVDHFDIDRESSTGWINIGSIGAKNDRLGSTYSLLDENAPTNKLTYRLTEVDLDASRTLIGTTAVGPFGGQDAFSVKVFPNPTSQSIHVMLTGSTEDASLYLYDALGKVVASREHIASSTVDFDATGLSTGSYWLEARDGSSVTRTKVSVTK